MVAALRWSLRWALAGGAAILVCGAIFLLASGTGESDLGSAKDFDTTTSGRVDLVRGGLELAEDRPIWGWGSGSFGAAFSRHIERARTTVSHSEPITVAAEQGAIGLAVYLALVVVALVVLLSGGVASAGPAAAAACFVAMLVHSLELCGLRNRPRYLGAARHGCRVAAVASSPGGGLCRRRRPRCPRSQERRPAAVQQWPSGMTSAT